jgi:hypothetical protein
MFLLQLFSYFLSQNQPSYLQSKLFLHVIVKAKIHCGVLLIFCEYHLILTNSAIILDVRNKYNSIRLSDL